MKVFAPQFTVHPNYIPHPTKAQAFDSLEEARGSYAYFIEECDQAGQTPADGLLYLGEPDGDEEKHGYPDYPDYNLSVGERGGIRTRKLA